MAILQLLIDGQGDVVGIRTVETGPLTDAFHTAVGAYSFGVSDGQSRLAGDRRFTFLVEQSRKLTDQEKSQIETLILGRKVGDTVAVASADDSAGQQVAIPNVGDAAGQNRTVIQVFFDP